MRFVIKTARPIPDTLASDNTQVKFSNLCRANSADRKKLLETLTSYWRGRYEDDGVKRYGVVESLENLYYGKCAYCERECETEIEHYRPKGGVKEDKSHSGYYWLAFEWTNLLPACHNCNNCKSHQFPIQNISQRASYPLINGVLDFAQFNISHNALISESPFLLNPEVDNPEGLFIFEWEEQGIVIKSRDSNLPNRASETIRICNLNRKSLKRERANVVKSEIITPINDVLALIADFLGDKNNDNELIILAINKIFSRLESNSLNEELEFTLLRKFVMEDSTNFDNLILIHHEERELLFRAFNFFKNK